jgi:hypothetical protein
MYKKHRHMTTMKKSKKRIKKMMMEIWILIMFLHHPHQNAGM